jgi:cell division protein YceG involved in septum cleavage
MMTDRFRAAWRGLNTDAGVHETVTLASLVEKRASSKKSARSSPRCSPTGCAWA